KYSQAIGISGLTPGAGGTTGLRNLTVTNNDFQAVTAFQAVTQSASFNSSAEHWSNNTYNVPGNQKTPIIVGGQSLTISAWTANWNTHGLNATTGKDYVAASGTTTFNPGETTSSITVKVNGDKTKEGNDTFAVNLTSATNAKIADSQGVAKILNDD